MYILAGKKILITAPTNNAVEQTLYGVLSVLEEANVPLDGILRLGIASAEFVERYPSLCEDTALAKQLSDVANQITVTRNQIAENEELIKLLPGAARCKTFECGLMQCSESLPLAFAELRELLLQEKETENIITLLGGKRTLCVEKIEQLKKESVKSANNVKELNAKVRKYGGRIWKALAPKLFERYILELKIAVEKAGVLDVEEKEQRKLLEENVSATQKQTYELEKQHLAIRSCKSKVVETTVFWDKLNSVARQVVNTDDLDAAYKRINDLLAEGQHRLEGAAIKYAKMQGLSEQTLLSRHRHRS